MPKAFWRSDSQNVRVMKAVVSGTGHTVGKNYETHALRAGDIGISMRVDRGTVDALTVEQNQAAISVIQGMSRELLESLGHFEDASIFTPGSIVNFVACGKTPSTGMVVRATAQGLVLKVMSGYEDSLGKRLITTFHPWTVQFTEIPEFTETIGLLTYLAIKADKTALELIPDDNQEALAQVVTHCDNIVFAKTALERLTDQKLLEKLAREIYQGLKYEVAMKLTDQFVIIAIAMSMINTQEHECRALLEKITDKSLLTQIAMRHDNTLMCWVALFLIKDHDTCKNISRLAEHPDNRRNAIAWIRDDSTDPTAHQEFFAERAVQDENKDVRLIAAIAITNPDLINRVAGETTDTDLLREWVEQEKITDMAVLQKIIDNNNNETGLNASLLLQKLKIRAAFKAKLIKESYPIYESIIIMFASDIINFDQSIREDYMRRDAMLFFESDQTFDEFLATISANMRLQKQIADCLRAIGRKEAEKIV